MPSFFCQTALLPTGWADAVVIDIGGDGRITRVAVGDRPPVVDADLAAALPGMPNLHSHAFQRGMAGLAEIAGPGGDSFWTWRQVMYRFLDRLTPDDVEAIAAQLYVEMLEAGFTSVGEFHYLHHAADGRPYDDPAEMAARIAAAADWSGIGMTLLPVFYAQGGFGGQPSEPQQRRFHTDPALFSRLHSSAAAHLRELPHARIGIAPHSLRAVTPANLAALVAGHTEGPIHIHVAEQTKEVADCLAWSGQRPVDWLLTHQPVDRRWCLIHATHMTAAETAALASSGAVAGLCPQTEANLGDGIFDGVAFARAGGSFGIGTDSHIRVDLAEEMRTLEYSQRLRDRARNVFAAEGASSGRFLYQRAVAGGAQALARPAPAIAVGALADIVNLDTSHPALVGRRHDALLDSFVFSADRSAVANVYVAGREVVSGGRHVRREAIYRRFADAIRRFGE